MATLPLHTGALPRGELLGRYRSYEDAQKVVDHLAADHDFDVKTLTIVGNDLRSVEKVRGRLSYPRVAGTGALQGALFGAFIGLLLMLFSPEAPLLNLVMAVLMGMAIWMIVGVVSFAARRGTRGFVSASQLTATTYDVVCDFQVAQQARRLVAGAGVSSLNALNDPTGRPPGMAQQGQGGQGPATPAAAPPAATSFGGSSDGPAQAHGSDVAPGQTQAQNHDPAPQVPAPTAATQPGPAQPPEDAEYADRPRAAQQWQQPDGRPRYGVRLQDTPQESAAQRETPRPADERGPARRESSAQQQSPAAPEGENHEAAEGVDQENTRA